MKGENKGGREGGKEREGEEGKEKGRRKGKEGRRGKDPRPAKGRCEETRALTPGWVVKQDLTFSANPPGDHL